MTDDFYRQLEERFRSSQAVIRERLEVYRPFLKALMQEVSQPKALDIGCGRGEWLQLLKEAGFEARGVDLDDSMLEACHERGLIAENQDALAALQALPDGSIDLISSFHVVEHLTFDYLRSMLCEAQRVLSPQGLLILETPNSENLSVGTSDFWLDPTHERPLPPPFLEFLCEFSGFQRTKILRLQEHSSLRDPAAPIGLLNVLFHVSPDYAVLARNTPVTAGQPDAFAEVFAQDYGLKLETLASRFDQGLAVGLDRVGQRAEKIGHELSDQAQRQAENFINHMQGQVQAFDNRLQKQAEEFEGRLQQLDEAFTGRLEALSQTHHEQLAEIDARYTDTLHRNWAYQQELIGLYGSTSWRVTRPLRGMVRLIREPDFRKRVALSPVNGTLRYLRTKPRFMGALKSVVRKVPALERRLRDYQQSVARATASLIPTPEPISNYSPRVEYLQRRMQRLLCADAAPVVEQPADRLPRLAFVSPLPPERSGIADYSAELLPALAAYYRIDLIVEQPVVNSPWINEHCEIHDADWLKAHASEFQAVLYHIGNSTYHSFMIELMDEVPGIIVLHDFFVSDLNRTMSARANSHRLTYQTLYYCHGYPAMADPLSEANSFNYPVNRLLLERAQGVIVHSAVSQRLAQHWYGEDAGRDWSMVPLLREFATSQPRREVRQALNIPEEAFLICSFGLLGTTKLNDRLLQAWLASELARDPNCILVFVGVAGDTPYCHDLLKAIEDSGLGARVQVTGWADTLTFKQYLAAADLAVQLRAFSRGETSATVLDCMNYSLPCIVNANGSMADLPEEAVYRIEDEFETSALTDAIETLWRDAAAREALGKRGRLVLERQHSPEYCAGLYHEAISQARQRQEVENVQLRECFSQLPEPLQAVAADADGAQVHRLKEALLALSDELIQGKPDPYQPRQLLLDITATCQVDRHTGIERVARALTLALLEQPPVGYRVEPVYLAHSEGRWHYRYATSYTAGLLGLSRELADQGIDYAPGDQLLTLDVSGQSLVLAHQAGVISLMQARGVDCRAVVFDLLPVTHAHFFPPNANVYFADWLECVAQFNGVICISATVAQEMKTWLLANQPDRAETLAIAHFHLGADLSHTAPSTGLPDNASLILKSLKSRPSILMVGTLEPRKGYLQAVEAFTRLWDEGVDVNLVIVGRAGWQQLPVDQQRSIPQLLERLAGHPEKGGRLFWLDGISDEFLEQVYLNVDGLLAASEDEGFGLPLIESAQKGLPILARDIPVFREVAGEHAAFFSAQEPAELASAIKEWVASGFTPSSSGMPWLTWRQSADDLQALLITESTASTET